MPRFVILLVIALLLFIVSFVVAYEMFHTPEASVPSQLVGHISYEAPLVEQQAVLILQGVAVCLVEYHVRVRM